MEPGLRRIYKLVKKPVTMDKLKPGDLFMMNGGKKDKHLTGKEVFLAQGKAGLISDGTKKRSMIDAEMLHR